MSTARTTSAAMGAAQSGSLSVAFAGVWLFFLVYYARPSEWLPGAETFPFAKVAAFVAIAGFLAALPLRGPRVIRPIFQSAELKGLACLYAYMWLTIPTAIWPGGSFKHLTTDYWKIIAITLLIGATVNSLSRLRKLLFVSALSMVVMSIFAIRSYFLGEFIRGRVEGVLRGLFGNPNDLAFNIVIVLPFCLALVLSAKSRPRRLFWAVCAATMTLAVIVTFSRAGFLALLAGALVALWEFGVKGRRHLLIALSMLFAIGLAVWLVPPAYQNRLSTIVSPETDETGSAQQRQLLLQRSLAVTLERPLFGVGPGNFRVVSGMWKDTHNTYLEMSAEAGIPALLLFLYILWRAFGSISRTIRSTEYDKSLQLLAQGSRASLAALVVGFLFHSVSYHFFSYLVIGYVVALSQIAHQSSLNLAGSSQESKGREFAIWREATPRMSVDMSAS